MSSRYGYIGLGAMGAAMTGHLSRVLAENEPEATLTVFDIDEAAIAAAVSHGALPAASAAGVAASSDIVSVCVPASHHIEQVFSAPGGLIEGAHDGMTVLIHSTVHPHTVVEAVEAAKSWDADVAVFEACVAGGTEAADIGELAIFAGGHSEMSADVTQLLDVYGSKVIDAGAVGAGATLKICFNVMSYAQFAAAKISHTLMESSGADTGALFEAWKHIGQLTPLTEQYSTLLSIPVELITGDLRDGLALKAGIAEKDLELARSLGARTGAADDVLAALHAAMPLVMGVSE